MRSRLRPADMQISIPDLYPPVGACAGLAGSRTPEVKVLHMSSGNPIGSHPIHLLHRFSYDSLTHVAFFASSHSTFALCKTQRCGLENVGGCLPLP